MNGRISTLKNATYRSKTTQNELINICNDIIISKLKCEVKKAKFFSILADEASDVSNMEQMPLVLCFVNDNCEICELFFGFIPCDSGLSGEAIGSQILNSIKDLGLEMKFCVGQGYDGAGNMAGNCSGAAVRIKAIYPKALYVYCGSHVLNLCVANASHHSRLIDVCRTRWIARIDGLDVFIEVLPAIIKCFELMINNNEKSWNHDSVRDANSYFFASRSFQFLVTLVVVSRCLERLRSDIEHSHGAWYSEAVVLAASVGVYEHKPRTIGKQLN
nr:52 kDa repressor of the inhibitor of the protein kinase-like [Hydra vulgaris]